MDRRETWIHVHGAQLLSSRLLSVIPGSLRVLTLDHVTIEATHRATTADCSTCGITSVQVQAFFVKC